MINLDDLKYFDLQLAGKPELLISESRKYRDSFLNNIDSEYWLTITNIQEFYESFRKFFFVMSLCPSQEVFDRYDEILNKRMEYKWCLDGEVFLNKINEINRENKVYIPVNFSFLMWMKYLDEQIDFYCRTELLKVMANLEQFNGVADQDFLKKLQAGYDPEQIFKNYFRRRESNAEKKKPFDLLLNETFEIIAKSVDNESRYNLLEGFKSGFFAALNGETENGHLRAIFDASLVLPGYYKIEKSVVFFDWLKFLLKDKTSEKFPSEAEFEDQESSFENNYRKYQEAKIITILGLRRNPSNIASD